MSNPLTPQNHDANIKIIPQPNTHSITFQPGGNTSTPILKIGEDGFWVRGVKVPVDENEGIAVFNAFKRWMVETELRRPY